MCIRDSATALRALHTESWRYANPLMDLARVERLRREAEETRRRDDQEMSLAVRRAFFASPVFPLALKGVVAYLLTFEDRGEALPTVVQAARESGITERHMLSLIHISFGK